MNNTFELSQVIKGLREDLKEAVRDGDGEKIRFNVSNIEIELQTVMEKEAGAEVGAKAKFWVLDTSAKVNGKDKESAIHKIKLSLQPVDTSKGDENKNNGSNTVQLTGKV